MASFLSFPGGGQPAIIFFSGQTVRAQPYTWAATWEIRNAQGQSGRVLATQGAPVGTQSLGVGKYLALQSEALC